MTAVVGFAFLWLAVTPVGKLVFLLVVAAIPNAMLCMTTTAGMVQKAAFGRSKSPADAGKKKRPHSGHPRVDRSVLTSPIPDSSKGKLFVQIILDTARRSSSHLEQAGEDFSFELPPLAEQTRIPLPINQKPSPTNRKPLSSPPQGTGAPSCCV